MLLFALIFFEYIITRGEKENFFNVPVILWILKVPTMCDNFKLSLENKKSFFGTKDQTISTKVSRVTLPFSFSLSLSKQLTINNSHR